MGYFVNIKSIKLILSAGLLFLTLGCSSISDMSDSLGISNKDKPVVKAPTEKQALKLAVKKEPFYNENFEQNPVKIAILVPLSGTYAKIGRELLDSAQLALFDLKHKNITLVPVDTGNNNNAKASSAAELLISQNIKIAIGPLFSDTTRIINNMVKDKNIKIISFSNDRALAKTGANILGLSVEEQIERVISYALDRCEIKRYIAVLPRNAYGLVVEKQAQQMVSLNGVFNPIYYERLPTDYSDIIKQINDFANENNNLPNLTSKCNDIKTALLLPEAGIVTSKVTEGLNDNIFSKKILILGSSKWDDNSLLANNYLEGAIFPTMQSDKQQEFKQNFLHTYNYKPDNIASIAYDAMSLAVMLSGFNKEDQNILNNPRGFVGIDGIFRFNNNGLAERSLAIIRIKQHNFEVLDQNPSFFR